MAHAYFLKTAFDNQTIESEIDRVQFGKLQVGDAIAIRHGVRSSEIGGGGSLYFVRALVALAMTILLAIAYRSRRQSTRPWFRRQIIEKGAGRLPGK